MHKERITAMSEQLNRELYRMPRGIVYSLWRKYSEGKEDKEFEIPKLARWIVEDGFSSVKTRSPN